MLVHYLCYLLFIWYDDALLILYMYNNFVFFFENVKKNIISTTRRLKTTRLKTIYNQIN